MAEEQEKGVIILPDYEDDLFAASESEDEADRPLNAVFCPVLQDWTIDPIFTSTKQYYDRETVNKWWRISKTTLCPVTMEEVTRYWNVYIVKDGDNSKFIYI